MKKQTEKPLRRETEMTKLKIAGLAVLTGLAIYGAKLSAEYSIKQFQSLNQARKQRTEERAQAQSLIDQEIQEIWRDNAKQWVQYGQDIEYERSKQEAEPVTDSFITSLQMKESTNNPRAVSSKGARGLMQIMKPTWNEMTKEVYGEELDYDLAFDPRINKEVGVAYLNRIDGILTSNLEGYSKMPIKEKQKKIAAAYNGGITRLLRKKGDISKMFKETRDYVPAVTNKL